MNVHQLAPTHKTSFVHKVGVVHSTGQIELFLEKRPARKVKAHGSSSANA